MAIDIIVEQLPQSSTEEQELEIVERKGLGHPDSICDAIANRASVALCREYERLFGRILHHNLDKATLVAGGSTPKLGGGQIDKPMLMIFGDRAVSAFAGKTVDVPGIVFAAAKDWLRQNLRLVDPERHMRFQSLIERGSPELTGLFEQDEAGANDTSAAVGFAPFTSTERLVMVLERHLNSDEFKRIFPETGEDVKVMAVRRGRKLHLTIAVAFIDRFVAGREAYFRRRDQIRQYLLDYTAKLGPAFENIRIDLNALDDPTSANGMYLTVLGISAEGADSGQVGRGNRANGVISITRPQSIEAHAGKNPVNHIGKIYSYFSHHAARQIYCKVPGIREVCVYLCGQIGKPINQPLVSAVKLGLQPGVSLKDVERSAASVLQHELSQISGFRKLLATNSFYDQWEQDLLEAKNGD